MTLQSECHNRNPHFASQSIHLCVQYRTHGRLRPSSIVANKLTRESRTETRDWLESVSGLHLTLRWVLLPTIDRLSQGRSPAMTNPAAARPTINDSTSVLCPIDFSPASLAAIPLAIDQAQSRGAVLDLHHVWQPGREYSGDGPPIPFAAEQPTERIENDLASLLQGDLSLPERMQVRFHVTSGEPSDDIVNLATELNSTLVVMGTHARRGVRHWIIGSVCAPVLRHCPCPVLITRGPEQPS